MCCKIEKYYISSCIVLSYVISYTISYIQCPTYINSRGVTLIKALIKLLQISALTWYQNLSTLNRFFYSLLHILLITAIPAFLFFLCCRSFSLLLAYSSLSTAYNFYVCWTCLADISSLSKAFSIKGSSPLRRFSSIGYSYSSLLLLLP